ncbi:predicted protein [Lichtheimia corymbifera JMRC:FSU:9682]|uniref:Uncharacterized protein n=1 Tax=Lichtheimia corymbifera JMRC:FSU:9682 TaxID=1263082 RepID=A0A068S6F5_9FUNG|nr:predicted protein [Lichtheimia corymbifera JMRC:FSU:9682]
MPSFTDVVPFGRNPFCLIRYGMNIIVQSLLPHRCHYHPKLVPNTVPVSPYYVAAWWICSRCIMCTNAKDWGSCDRRNETRFQPCR